MSKRLLLVVIGLGVAACAGGESEHAATPDSFATGRSCAEASGSCDGGRCAVDVDNRCDTPLTCRLRVESLCRSTNGDTGPANASSVKLTQLAGTKHTLEAEIDCTPGTPLLTHVQALECI
jgi:hypothetical protein